MKARKINSKELDAKFESGEDVLDSFDLEKGERLNQSKRINLELPNWMLLQLDLEATRLGVPRQAVIKFILDEKLKRVS